MKMLSVKALTMVELLVVVVISSILVLMVGSLSQVAFTSHEEVRKEGAEYSDIFYGFNLLTYSVRNASTVNTTNGLTLISDSGNINPYNRTFKTYNNTDLGFTDSNKPNYVNIIIKGVSGLNFNFCCEDNSGNCSVNNCSINSNKRFHITLNGTKDNEPFNLSSDIMRRN
jgi:hypothetical protein